MAAGVKERGTLLLIGHKTELEGGYYCGGDDIFGERSCINPKVAAEPTSVLKDNLECMVINVFVDIEPSECIKCSSKLKSPQNTSSAKYW